jgi:hypothetical protein
MFLQKILFTVSNNQIYALDNLICVIECEILHIKFQRKKRKKNYYLEFYNYEKNAHEVGALTTNQLGICINSCLNRIPMFT